MSGKLRRNYRMEAVFLLIENLARVKSSDLKPDEIENRIERLKTTDKTDSETIDLIVKLLTLTQFENDYIVEYIPNGEDLLIERETAKGSDRMMAKGFGEREIFDIFKEEVDHLDVWGEYYVGIYGYKYDTHYDVEDEKEEYLGDQPLRDRYCMELLREIIFSLSPDLTVLEAKMMQYYHGNKMPSLALRVLRMLLTGNRVDERVEDKELDDIHFARSFILAYELSRRNIDFYDLTEEENALIDRFICRT
jgi:hypothetical protein